MLRYIDSFDHYLTADVERKWTTLFSEAQIAISTNGGRCGSSALQMGGGFAECYKGVVTSGATAIFGFALKYETDAIAGDTPIFSFGPGTDVHLKMRRVWNDGSLQFLRSTSTGDVSVGYTSPDTIRMNTYYYVEIKVLLHASAGTLEVRINGNSTPVLSLSGIKTLGDTTEGDLAATWSWFGFNASNVSVYYVDDLYVADGAAGHVTDFLGDQTVEYLRPISDGALTDWDVTGNADRWSAVDDDRTPDGDTDYISTATPDDINLANYEDPTLVSPVINGVQVSIDATKVDSGDRTIAAVVRHSGTDYLGPDHAPPQGQYLYHITMFEENPGTTDPWTLADLQAAQFGVKLTS
jgi:hypothetical protein